MRASNINTNSVCYGSQHSSIGNLGMGKLITAPVDGLHAGAATRLLLQWRRCVAATSPC
jgi:hypothetical protein